MRKKQPTPKGNSVAAETVAAANCRRPLEEPDRVEGRVVTASHRKRKAEAAARSKQKHDKNVVAELENPDATQPPPDMEVDSSDTDEETTSDVPDDDDDSDAAGESDTVLETAPAQEEAKEEEAAALRRRMRQRLK